MKKLIMTIAIVFGLGMITFAQDAAVEEKGLFGRGEGIYRSEEKTLVTPGLPNHGESERHRRADGSWRRLHGGQEAQGGINKAPYGATRRYCRGGTSFLFFFNIFLILWKNFLILQPLREQF